MSNHFHVMNQNSGEYEKLITVIKFISLAAQGNYHRVFRHQSMAGEKERIVQNLIGCILDESNTTTKLWGEVDMVVEPNCSPLFRYSSAYQCLKEGQYLYQVGEKVYPTTKLLQHLYLHFLSTITEDVSVVTEAGCIPIANAQHILDDSN